MSHSTPLRINRERLWQRLEDMATIGPGVAGGNNRQALTQADGMARNLLRRWSTELGLLLGVDVMGNMFLTRPGQDERARPVYFGSHLDTQPTGGRYDGVYGVLAGLELMQCLNEAEVQTRRPLVLVNWSNEEGSRFAPSILGSGTFVGHFDVPWAHQRQDSEGTLFGEALQQIGWLGAETCGARSMHAYFELHIEQGPVLEAEQLDVGVVTHAQGCYWLRVRVTGEDRHAGSTPMPLRRDAGLGMARLLQQVEQTARHFAPYGVGTVGRCALLPGSPNVVPGAAEFTIDFRHPDSGQLQAMMTHWQQQAEQLCAEAGLGLDIESLGGFDPVAFDTDCVASVREACQSLGYAHRDMVSGAGHDACMISREFPTAMIFCPCVQGISHNEAEAITPEWAAAGADVLLNAVLAQAN